MKLKEFILTCMAAAIICIGIITAWTLLMNRQNTTITNVSLKADSADHEAYITQVNSQYDQTVTFKVSNTLTNIYNSNSASLQMIHEAIRQHGPGSPEVKQLCQVKSDQDKANTKTVAEIIDKYGWLSANRIGAQNNYTLYMVIQNSDFETQQKYMTVMEAAAKSGSLAPECYAQLVDRKALAEHRQQIFGTQVKHDASSGKYSFAPIVNEELVNQRRAEIGLPPIQTEAAKWNIAYVAVQKAA